MSSTSHYDVLVVGAGLSGIAAAYYLQERCPGRSFAILEARESLGGTWDLFRYPGIRSDSDMYTLGYSFYPWKDAQAIADGSSILSYLHETAEHFGIASKICYGKRVEQASWSSEEQRWAVTTRDQKTGECLEYTCNFLWACTGYYSYESGYTPKFAGADSYRGRLIHPQQWPDDLDYEGKKVVVIGSGATAMTLVPELAESAGHVTMLQRSPTYLISRPDTDGVAQFLEKFAGPRLGFNIARWKNVLLSMFFYEFSRRFPRQARRYLIGQVRDALGDDYDVGTHFNPSYDPWDERLCLIPNDDLFKAIRAERVSIVTDHVDAFTEGGVALRSGEELEADIVVTATGLRLEFLGGATVQVDGEPIEPSEKFMYKGTMLSDVPNAAISLGYTNASWTLKCELSSEYVCRLLNHMEEHGLAVCTPRAPRSELEEVPLIDFTSGYIQRALGELPKQGSRSPWRLYQNYILDRVLFRRMPIDDGALEFS